MSTKPARFTFLLAPELKQQFEAVCRASDITPSQVLRQLVKSHVAGQAPLKARVGPGPGKGSRKA